MERRCCVHARKHDGKKEGSDHPDNEASSKPETRRCHQRPQERAGGNNQRSKGEVKPPAEFLYHLHQGLSFGGFTAAITTSVESVAVVLIGVVRRLTGRLTVGVIVGLRPEVFAAVSALFYGRIDDDGLSGFFVVTYGNNGPVSNGVVVAVIFAVSSV
jgi:hypothetical protein